MRKPQNFQWKEMTMGTCYYPEHWSRELWQDDLQRMKAAGITVIRVAEFAWNKVEPEEGVFTFDFWDEFMDFMSFLGELEDTFDIELEETEVTQITTLEEALKLLEELQ